MFDVKEWIVPALRGAGVYSQKLGVISDENPGYARMCLNENPLPQSSAVMEALKKVGELGSRYPGLCLDLRTKLAGMFDLGPENVCLANGSSEIIDSMMRAFLQEGDEVLLPTPTFSLFYARASVVGATQKLIPFTDGELDYDVNNYLDAITDKTKLILVVTPNNPTGAFMAEGDLRKILDRGIPTCIDEAYLEFHPDMPNMAHLVKEYPNAFVSHTMSKAYGMAGIRFGYVLAQPAMLEVFETLALPWNLGHAPLLAAEAALDDKETLQRNVEYMSRWNGAFSETLAGLGLKPLHAAGNFLMIDANVSGKTSQEIFDAALEAGVILKTIGAVHGKKGYFRITPGTDEENERAMAFFKGFFG